MDLAFKAADIAIVCATMLGPVLAVEAQKQLDRFRGIDDRRRAIFRTLMATRAANLSPAHVEALNAIPVEYHGRGAKLKRINDHWKDYLDHLNVVGVATEAWGQKRLDLFYDLMSAMSDFLGYRFTRSQLQRDVYSPIGHANLEGEQNAIRQGLANILSGKAALPMTVVGLPNANAPQTEGPSLLDQSPPPVQ